MIPLFITVPLLVILFDRITKWWALTFVCQAPLSLVGDYLSCMVTYNRGVSWSLLSNNTAYGFIAVALLIVGVIGMLVAHTVRAYQQKQRIFGELLVLGGALSNLYDRFFYDGVVDFITLRYGDWVFPIFNIADIAIVFGVLIMLYDATLRR
jgi:signal peptidase II